jgi:hypothetical protein
MGMVITSPYLSRDSMPQPWARLFYRDNNTFSDPFRGYTILEHLKEKAVVLFQTSSNRTTCHEARGVASLLRSLPISLNSTARKALQPCLLVPATCRNLSFHVPLRHVVVVLLIGSSLYLAIFHTSSTQHTTGLGLLFSRTRLSYVLNVSCYSLSGVLFDLFLSHRLSVSHAFIEPTSPRLL